MSRRTPKADAASQPVRRHSVTLFPTGEHPGYQPLQDRKGPVPTNVVPIRPMREKPADIAVRVRTRRIAKERAILDMLKETTRFLEDRHERTLAELPAIGRGMDHQALLDWIAIGREMLGQGGRA